MIKNDPDRRWFRLDNAAKIYPVIMNSRHPTVFRVASVLRVPVDPVLLQQAAEQTLLRFPAFKVQLRAGVFWYYLEENPADFCVEPENEFPCRPFSKHERHGYRLRVLYYGKRIAVEMFHSLADGSGALIFLKTLTAQYLRLRGETIGFSDTVFDVNAQPDAEELEDAHARHANFRVIRRPSETIAYHLHGTPLPEEEACVISGAIPLDRILAKAREYSVTLTELLAALMIARIQEIQHDGVFQHRRPIRISIPVNMRRYFPSATVRNFSLFANPGIEPAFGEYSFEEIVSQVHHFMRYYMTAKNLNALMCANVRPERSAVLRITPLPLKTLAMRFAYHQSGESRYTSVLSNIGQIVLPEEMVPHVERFEFVLGPSRDNPVLCGVMSYGDRLYVTFTGTLRETTLQREFFRTLVEWGIPVEIESNGASIRS